jgi:hypothetical protein
MVYQKYKILNTKYSMQKKQFFVTGNELFYLYKAV